MVYKKYLAVFVFIFSAYLVLAQVPNPGHSWEQMIRDGNLSIDTETGSVSIGSATATSYKFRVLKDDGVTSGEHVIAQIGRASSGTSIILGYRADGTSVTGAVVRAGGSGGTGDLSIGTYSNPQTIHITNTGNVGIGTTNPTAKLDVSGDLHASGNLLADGALVRFNGIGASTLNYKIITIDDAGYLSWRAPDASWPGGGSGGGGETYWTINGQQEIYNTNAGGNVGIGTNNPTEKLHVVGNTYITGNVGLGTSSLAERLVVNGNIGIENGGKITWNQDAEIIGSASTNNININGLLFINDLVVLQNGASAPLSCFSAIYGALYYDTDHASNPQAGTVCFCAKNNQWKSVIDGSDCS